MDVGVVGLGNMGSALCANLVEAGLDVQAFDVAGPERLPDGARWARGIDAIAGSCEVVVLSLPDGRAVADVVSALVEPASRRVAHVADTSTIGVTAARAAADELATHGVGYVDAPVSGGVAGARARTLTVMYAGDDAACTAVEPVLRGLSDSRRRVGDRAGLAQAMKLANNFLSATALAATSEAVAFGCAAGLDMATMLDVLNVSSGRSAATEDKFPNHVLTGRYAAGFANTLMAKDVRLYLREVERDGGPAAVGELIDEIWDGFASAEPGADFTRIHDWVGVRKRPSR